MKDKNLCVKKPLTLGACNRQFRSKGGGISCSYTFLGICEAIFRGRDLIFWCGTSYQYILHGNQIIVII